MSSPTIEKLRGQNDVWRQISKQLKEVEEFENKIILRKGGTK